MPPLSKASTSKALCRRVMVSTRFAVRKSTTTSRPIAPRSSTPSCAPTTESTAIFRSTCVPRKCAKSPLSSGPPSARPFRRASSSRPTSPSASIASRFRANHPKSVARLWLTRVAPGSRLAECASCRCRDTRAMSTASPCVPSRWDTRKTAASNSVAPGISRLFWDRHQHPASTASCASTDLASVVPPSAQNSAFQASLARAPSTSTGSTTPAETTAPVQANSCPSTLAHEESSTRHGRPRSTQHSCCARNSLTSPTRPLSRLGAKTTSTRVASTRRVPNSIAPATTHRSRC